MLTPAATDQLRSRRVLLRPRDRLTAGLRDHLPATSQGDQERALHGLPRGLCGLLGLNHAAAAEIPVSPHDVALTARAATGADRGALAFGPRSGPVLVLLLGIFAFASHAHALLHLR